MRIDGRVVDVAGKPIPGARICESSRGLTFLEYVRNTETDLDGRFHLHFEPDEKIKLTVQVSGFEPVTRSFVARPDLGPVEFQLDAGKVIRGRVVDVNGKPVPGANVILPNQPRNGGIFLRTWTDMQGRFVWGSAPAGQVELMIGKEGYRWIDRAPFTADDKEKEVVLKPGLTVEIIALDAASSKAINNFSIETGVLDPTTGVVDWKPELTRSVSDGEFRTTLDATMAPYRFRIKAEGYAPKLSREIRPEEKDVAEEIEMEKLKNP